MLYGLLNLYALIALLWAIGGYMNDHNNRYPVPLMLSAAAAATFSATFI
jgi:hypothetical protein